MIHVRRTEMQLSLDDLAAAVKTVTAHQLRQFENGENNITVSQLWEIAQVLKVDVAYFYNGIPSEEHNHSDIFRRYCENMSDEQRKALARLMRAMIESIKM